MKIVVRLLKVVGVLGVIFLLMQLVPYGREYRNPPATREPAWDSPRTRELAKRACFDCHSNETTWPSYSKIAPFSWVVYRDVKIAREVVNFSEWDKPYAVGIYAGQSVKDGSMPPGKYTVAHPEARLTPEEKEALWRGLDKTLDRP